MQKTYLGWIISGKVNITYPRSALTVNCSAKRKQISKFWQLEESSSSSPVTLDHKAAETHFLAYVVETYSAAHQVRLQYMYYVYIYSICTMSDIKNGDKS